MANHLHINLEGGCQNQLVKLETLHRDDSNNAFCWKTKEVGITLELCIYCGACVLSCIVDDCIKIVRKRPTGEVESFREPTEVVVL